MSTLPRKSFARKMVSMKWAREDALNEIASLDKVDHEEAGRRYDLADEQFRKRSIAQYMRHARARNAVDAARFHVFLMADTGIFRCPEDLSAISEQAGWGWETGPDSTGRAYLEFVLRPARAGLLTETRDEDDKLVGYTLTPAGRAHLAELTCPVSTKP